MCHDAKVVHVFEAQVLRKSPGYKIEITCGTQFSVTHAAPPDVSLAAVSSIGGLRTPAPGVRGATITGRHPKTFTGADLAGNEHCRHDLSATSVLSEPRTRREIVGLLSS